MKIKKLLSFVFPFLLLFSCSSNDRQIIDDSGMSKSGYDGIEIESVKVIDVVNPYEENPSSYIDPTNTYVRFDITYKNTGDYVSDWVKFEYNIKDDLGADFYKNGDKYISSEYVLYPGDTYTLSAYAYGENRSFSLAYADKYEVSINSVEAEYFPSAKIYSTDDDTIKISNLRFAKISVAEDTDKGTIYYYRADYDCSFELPGDYESEALSFVLIFFTVSGSDKEYGVSLTDYDQDKYLGSSSSLYFRTDREIDELTTTMHMKGILTYSKSREFVKKRTMTIIAFMICFSVIPVLSLIAMIVIIVIGLTKKPKNS